MMAKKTNEQNMEQLLQNEEHPAEAAAVDSGVDLDTLAVPVVAGMAENDIDQVEENAPMEAALPPAEEMTSDDPIPGSPTNPRRRVRRGPTDDQRIIEGDADINLIALTPEQDRQRRWLKIVEVKDHANILERPIAGVEPAGDGRATPRVFVYYNDFRIAISTRDFFDGVTLFSNDFATAGEGERNNREFQMATKMMGAYIPFVITAAHSIVDEHTGERVFAVRGSRIEALRRKKDRWYFGETPRIAVGNRVKGRVLMPTTRGVLMEVVGHEVFVPAGELSSCKWTDPLYDFPAGTVTYVDVMKLEVDREKRLIDMEVSRKPLDAADAKSSYESCHQGMRYIGTVVGVDRDYVRINLDCHVRAAAPILGLNGVKMRYGDRVSVAITRKRDDRRTVYGTCIPISTRPF